ncbi:hypothetical protein ACH5RR_041320 [Cinchona calisaya]|uniref:Leucine-rich repeat domain, L domain-containing protein n=1 Tax=Cinchona calisaya TaxID=153742 RepID=A0ABD2XYN1_9GENT
MYDNIELILEGISPKCFILSILILGNNLLSLIIDSFFAHLGGLQVLDLSHKSNLRELPFSISNLKKLKSLLLQFCYKLTFVPPLGNLKALRKLDLFGTSIEDVPKGIESLVGLRRFNINCTTLRIIPDGKLSELRLLYRLVIPKTVVNHRVYDILLVPDLMEANKYVTSSDLKTFCCMEHLEMYDCYDMGSCLSKTFLQLKFIHNKGFMNCKIVNYKGIRWILKLTSSSTTADGGQVGGRGVCSR